MFSKEIQNSRFKKKRLGNEQVKSIFVHITISVHFSKTKTIKLPDSNKKVIMITVDSNLYLYYNTQGFFRYTAGKEPKTREL